MPIALIALGVAAAGTAASIQQTREAGKAAKRQYAAEKQKAEIENVRSVRQQVRQARLAQASMMNAAAIGGTMGSSGMLGGIGSVGSQMAGNVNYMSEIAEQNTAITSSQLAQTRAASNAAIFGSIGQMAGTIFSDMGGLTYKPESALSKQAGAQVARGLRPTAGGL